MFIGGNMKNNEHSENTRVKIPAIVQFTRIGYKYLSIKKHEKNQIMVDPNNIDKDTNIFKNIFRDSINRINGTDLSEDDIDRIIEKLKIQLSNEDLGKQFYNSLLNGIDNIRLIEFNIEKKDLNSYHVVTELPFENEDESFRPDVIPLINGMPLSFVEVKKPNNPEGIIKEKDRINTRFKNKKFRRFMNMMQILVFSNNNEYDDNSTKPIEGAFYATNSTSDAFFNHFREQDENIYLNVQPINEEIVDYILNDNNYVALKGTREFETNLNDRTPTNRIITSLFSKERLLTILKYGIVYVDEKDKNGIIHKQKHIMRYPQLFATLRIQKKINDGLKRGIIWHTQGSGKTELAYYNVKHLTDYFQKKNIITKFYFVVDRLSLLIQTRNVFLARGLKVKTVNSREEFIRDFQSIGETDNTITVVNIQKFSEDSTAIEIDYNVNVQRIFFLDEAHRSYNPRGSFLANLMNSDRDAIMIALTGTPLIGEGFNTKDIFGEYIHTYYYNESIRDGYTLRLIREEIETTYKEKLDKVLKDLETLPGQFDKRNVYAHRKYVEPLTDYIVNDFKKARIRLNDNSIGGMIVCDSSQQAREVFSVLNEKYPELVKALILHDEDDKETREDEQDAFVEGRIDLLVVYNMLLTGFDAPKLKRLYLGRIIKAHNLLQTLTRVNRPYKEYQYGHVIDFANIKNEFDRTNREYYEELKKELGNEFDNYSNIFKSQEEIENEIKVIHDKLWQYNTEDLEQFSYQVNELEYKELNELRKILTDMKELYNVIKLYGYDIESRIDVSKISKMLSEVINRINIKHFTDNMMNSENTEGLLNMAMDDITFHFTKISEQEIKLADEFTDVFKRTTTEIEKNFDKKDPTYITLWEEFQRIFKSKNLEELSADEMKETIGFLSKILEKFKNKNAENNRIILKYENDVKFMRIHKRIKEMNQIRCSDIDLNMILLNIKHEIDKKVIRNNAIIDNESYFTGEIKPLVYDAMKKNGVFISYEDINRISDMISEEYIEERKEAI